MRKIILSILLVFTSVTLFGVYTRASKKKLLNFGWGLPRLIHYYKATTAEELEKYLPFDGFSIAPYIYVYRNGKKLVYTSNQLGPGTDILLTKEDLKEWVEVFSKYKFKKLTDNFFGMTTAQFGDDWFDDATWNKVLNNHKMLAWMAKECGFKGVVFDAEPYTVTCSPFAYRNNSKHSFAETEAKVRERGRQYARALTSVYPDITIFCYVLIDFYFKNANSPQNAYVSRMALYPAFWNGMLEVLPPGAKLIDGNEHPGYHAALKGEYDKMNSDFERERHATIFPENREKFNQVVSRSYASYLDSFIKGNSQYRNWTKSRYPVRLLYNTLRHSLEYCDEYAWVWAEKGAFYPQNIFKVKWQLWNDRLPGCIDAINAARDPLGSAKKFASPENLLENGNFTAGKNAGQNNGPGTLNFGVPYWSSWQGGPRPKGVIRAEKDGVCFRNVTNGSVVQSIQDFMPGDLFLLTAKCRMTGKGQKPEISIFYRDENGRGLWNIGKKAEFGQPDKDGWSETHILVEVPESPKLLALTVSCSVTGSWYGMSEDVSCTFKDVKLQRVLYPWWNYQEK
ncbi:MAG: hypothetical protein IKC82_06795 [Lentisphaeria bacterium]|nr:hypothetical protein [Lentisphaeria bacterium]